MNVAVLSLQVLQMLRPVVPVLRLVYGGHARAQLLAGALRQLVALAPGCGCPAPSTPSSVSAYPGQHHTSGSTAFAPSPYAAAPSPYAAASSPYAVTPSPYTVTASGRYGQPEALPAGRVLQLARVVYQQGGEQECALRCAAALHLAGRSGHGVGVEVAHGKQGARGVTCEQLAEVLGREQPAAWEQWTHLHPGDTASQVGASCTPTKHALWTL